MLLCFRGSGSRALKAKFYGPSSAKVLPIVTERDTKYVRLVTSYRHLGGVCHHTGDQRVELRQRQAIAQQALSQHRRLIYHNKAILWEKRVELFQSLVLTKLLYGAESWIATDAKTQEKFRVYVIGLYKRLARLPHEMATSPMRRSWQRSHCRVLMSCSDVRGYATLPRLSRRMHGPCLQLTLNGDPS